MNRDTGLRGWLRAHLSTTTIAAVLLFGGLVACGGDSGGPDGCEDGSAGCACFPNATCLDGLTCTAGLCQGPDADVGGDATSDTTAPPECVEIVPLRLWHSDPSAVAMLFTAEDCVTGDPYTGFASDDFVLREDGAPLSSEAVPRILPSEGLRVYVTLLLDLSSSTVPNLAELQAGALSFIEELLVVRELRNVWVGLQAFDGGTEPYMLERWTRDADSLRARVESLTTFVGDDPGSTNLNGATRSAVATLVDRQRLVMDMNAGGVVTTGVVVAFTDGGDTAQREDATLASATIAAARVYDGGETGSPTVSTLAVALRGADYDRAALASLVGGEEHVVESELDQLRATFTEVGRRIARRVDGTYLLAYCSPARAGDHTVSLSMAAGGANTVSFGFNADGFAGGCGGEFFETSCLVRECGGFNCGACDDTTQVCTGAEEGRCISACIYEGLCNGEEITNPFGYAQTCGGDSVASCGDGDCVDLSGDRDNCGGCGRACAAAESVCVSGVCVCAGGGLECGEACVDTLNDPLNCGACGARCDGDGQACTNGECLCGGETCVETKYLMQRFGVGATLPNQIDVLFRVFEDPCPLGSYCQTQPGRVTDAGSCIDVGSGASVGTCAAEGRRPVAGLELSAFVVEEEGTPISPSESRVRFENDAIEMRLQTAIVVDNSRSIGDALPTLKQAVRDLVEALSETQEIALYVFSEDVALVQDFTSNTALLVEAVDAITLGGSSTNLYGAVVTGGSRLETSFSIDEVVQGTLVIVTDGADTQGTQTLDAAIEAAARVETYTVGLGAETDEDVLRQLGASGGYLEASNADALGAVFDEIRAETETAARSVYRIVYDSPRRGAEERTVRVTIDRNANQGPGGSVEGTFGSALFFDGDAYEDYGFMELTLGEPFRRRPEHALLMARTDMDGETDLRIVVSPWSMCTILDAGACGGNTRNMALVFTNSLDEPPREISRSGDGWPGIEDFVLESYDQPFTGHDYLGSARVHFYLMHRTGSRGIIGELYDSGTWSDSMRVYGDGTLSPRSVGE